MLLTLSIPTLWPEDIVRDAASSAGAHARIKWAKPANPPYVPAEVRFKLVMAPGSFTPASNAAHDILIRELMIRDVNATIRTSRAIYRGQKDFLRQTANKLDSTD